MLVPSGVPSQRQILPLDGGHDPGGRAHGPHVGAISATDSLSWGWGKEDCPLPSPHERAEEWSLVDRRAVVERLRASPEFVLAKARTDLRRLARRRGISPATLRLPRGWPGRLVPLRNRNTAGVTGCCIEVHDLAVSKFLANREKDVEFCDALLRSGRIEADVLRARLEETECTPAERARILMHFGRLAAETERPASDAGGSAEPDR
jgi:hypothetical protein